MISLGEYRGILFLVERSGALPDEAIRSAHYSDIGCVAGLGVTAFLPRESVARFAYSRCRVYLRPYAYRGYYSRYGWRR